MGRDRLTRRLGTIIVAGVLGMTMFTSCSHGEKPESQETYTPQPLVSGAYSTTENMPTESKAESTGVTQASSPTAVLPTTPAGPSLPTEGQATIPTIPTPTMPERETVKPGTVYKVDFAPLYTQNKQNFSRALTAAINQGKLLAAADISQGKAYTIQIDIPKATYTFNAAISLKGAANLVLNGNGSTFVYTQKCSAVTMDSCSNITWRDITVDFKPLLFTQGVIVGISGNTIDLKIDAGYSTDMDYYINNGSNGANIIDASTGAMKAGTRDSFGVASYEKLSADTFRLNIGWDINTPVNNPVSQGQYFAKAGDLMVIKAHTVQTMVMNWCKNIRFDSVTLHNGGGSGFLEMYGDGGNTYKNVKVTPGPKPAGAARERLNSISGDVIHSASVKVGPLVENCLFEKQGDDGVNIHGFYGFSVKKVNDRTYLVSPKYIDIIQPGDQVEITGAYDYETQKITKAVSVKQVQRPDLEADAKKAWQGKHPPASFTSFVEITFQDAVELELGDGVCSITRTGSGSVIRDSTFRHNRSRGIVLKAFDSLVEGNTIENTGLSGIVCSTEIGYWGEAHFTRNIIIRNNKLIGCNTSVNVRTNGSDEIGAINVSIFAPLNFTGLLEARQNRNIVIENNTITDSYAYGMLLTNIDGLKVTGNTIRNSWRLGPDDGGGKLGIRQVSGHIFVANCTNGYIGGNTFENNRYITQGVQKGDGAAGVTVS